MISGRDGTRGYVTGEFNDKGLIDDISGFSLSQIHSVEHWVQFYKKQYSFKGILIHIGTFCVLYDTAFHAFLASSNSYHNLTLFYVLCSIEFPLKYDPPFYI